MSAELLARLRALDVRLVVDGDRLCCNAPRGVLTAELQEQLSAGKAELVALVRAEAAVAAEEVLVAPLAFAQERVWFMDQLRPGVAAYNITGALRLRGRLNVAALKRALAEIVHRHGALRTTFGVIDDQPMQIVHPAMPTQLPVMDLSGVPAGAREGKAMELSRESSRRPFDLTRGPLLRMGLLRLTAEDHVLHVSVHHIISDGWSMGVLVAELSALYSAYSEGRPSPLPALPTQYADYARWQRRHLAGEVMDRQLAYWRRQLGNELTVLDLPLDRPRPAEQSLVGAFEMFTLPTPLLERLRALARREQSTLFMVLLGAFQTLLYRYTGQDDVPVGTPIANRTRLESERLIGFFANTLVMRTDLSGRPSFREVLRRVRAMALDAYAHQDVPLGRVVEELNPVRDRARAPLFQVLFALQNVPAESLALPGLTLSLIPGDRGTAKTDLSLEMREQADGMVASMEYCSELFDAATIRRLWGHYEMLLQAVVDEPGRAVADLPLLTPDEERRIVVDWNDTALDHDRTRCLHHLLEESARRQPDVPAVIAGDTVLNYRALDQRANRLARLLARRGALPGSLVAVCLDRDAELPMALAAVLKAGAAYVPLDPTHPPERLRYTIEDAGVACIVTHSRFLPLVAGSAAAVVLIDLAESELAAESAEPPDVATQPHDLAYVIYTSGSTGRPKGVEVEHRNVVALLAAMRREPGLTHRDILLAITTPAFDIAALELWLPLSVGGRVVIASRADVMDPERLITLLERHQVTVLQATPSTWRMLIEAGWEGSSRLKALCGGEALPPDLAVALTARVGELWNLYGPTETTIWSTAARVEEGRDTVVIGRPIANTRVYVLDPEGKPVPIGAAGELCIGGEGVARGYRRRPELTAEKYVRLDLPGRPGERVYRTGDTARWRVDGALEYLGRRDQQIKLRGYRVELGEIEAVLRTHPGVTDCVVSAQSTVQGRQRLVAFTVLSGGGELDPHAVRATLRARLPEYMMPSAFVTLAALPVTANGKVDRKALEPPAEPEPGDGEIEDRPMTPAQRRVADIWEELLGRGRVGVYDNFFDAGGHSLLAVRLHARLKRAFGVEFPLIDVFQHTTVAALADLVMTGPVVPVGGVA